MPPIKTALLAFGMSGKVFHAPFINLHKGFLLAGAWERSKKAIQYIYPETISYPTMESILADESIDLVIVNTPNYSHFEYTKAALLAGKNVVVEKAFTTTLAEAVELKMLSEKVGKKISVFQSRRWDSDFKTVQKVKQAGLLGDVVEAALSYERFKSEIGPKQHKETAGPGAGLLNDLGPHLIDQALVLFGMPQSIFACIRTTRQHSKVDDWFELQFFYPTCSVRLKSGMFVREPLPAFVLHGTKGSFIKRRGDVQEAALLTGTQPNTNVWGTEPETESGWLYTDENGAVIKQKIATEQGNYYYFYDEVHKAITNNTAMPVTCDDGINVMKLIEASVQSNEEKRVVEL